MLNYEIKKNNIIKQIDNFFKTFNNNNNIDKIYYIPKRLIDNKNELLAVKQNNTYRYLNITNMTNPYEILEELSASLNPNRIQKQLIEFDENTVLNIKLKDLLTDCHELQPLDKEFEVLADKEINKMQNLENILNNIALPCRSTKKGFKDLSKLYAIDDCLKDSPYIKIYETEHVWIYGKKPVGKNEEPILISSHADIVSNIKKVSSELKNGFYHGTYDNLGTNAASVMLMLEENLPDNVYFAFTDEEETGRCFGAKDCIDYIKSVTKKNALYIALDVTDEGYHSNKLFSLEGLSAKDSIKKKITNAMLKTEGDNKSFCVVKAKAKDTTYFDKEYMTSTLTVFDESAYYGSQKVNTMSLCVPTVGPMHSDEGLYIKEPVFKGYILSLASFIHAYTNTNEKFIETCKIAKDNLINEAKETFRQYEHFSYPMEQGNNDLMYEMEAELYELCSYYPNKSAFVLSNIDTYEEYGFNEEALGEIWELYNLEYEEADNSDHDNLDDISMDYLDYGL